MSFGLFKSSIFTLRVDMALKLRACVVFVYVPGASQIGVSHLFEPSAQRSEALAAERATGQSARPLRLLPRLDSSRFVGRRVAKPAPIPEAPSSETRNRHGETGRANHGSPQPSKPVDGRQGRYRLVCFFGSCNCPPCVANFNVQDVLVYKSTAQRLKVL